MEVFITIFLRYLLMPLLALIAMVCGYFFLKKKKLLENKKLIFIMLLSGVLMALPALLGFLYSYFLPYIYVSLQVVYLVAGYFGMRALDDMFRKKDIAKTFWGIVVIQFIILFIGGALFSVIFNLCSDLKYGIWASTCVLPFLFPVVYRETFRAYLDIPPEIFKTWKYSEKIDVTPFDYMDFSGLSVLELDIAKNLSDPERTTIKAKAPQEMPFGVWFYKFLLDYNLKYPRNPIEFKNDARPYEWIFYTKPSFFSGRKYIDSDLSIAENRIRESYIIIAKRVSINNHTELE